MKTGRNDPCLCGSGKKYKKCCLSINNQGVHDMGGKMNESNLKYPFFELDIDILSNSVVDLLEIKNYKKAKEVCRELLERFPDQVDGYERFANVYEEEGNTAEAIKYYHKTIDFMRKNPGFDEDSINWSLKKIEELEKSIL